MKKINDTLIVQIVEKRSKKIKRADKATNLPVASKFIKEKGELHQK